MKSVFKHQDLHFFLSQSKQMSVIVGRNSDPQLQVKILIKKKKI